eukprot:COSAG04_NODE_1752_length_5696_cov_32.262679_6_plen_61_part_00
MMETAAEWRQQRPAPMIIEAERSCAARAARAWVVALYSRHSGRPLTAGLAPSWLATCGLQ